MGLQIVGGAAVEWKELDLELECLLTIENLMAENTAQSY